MSANGSDQVDACTLGSPYRIQPTAIDGIATEAGTLLVGRRTRGMQAEHLITARLGREVEHE